MGKELPTSTRDRQISEASTVLRHNVDIVTHKNSTSLLPPRFDSQVDEEPEFIPSNETLGPSC